MEDWKLLLGKGIFLLACVICYIVGLMTEQQMIGVIAFVMALDHIASGSTSYSLKKAARKK